MIKPKLWRVGWVGGWVGRFFSLVEGWIESRGSQLCVQELKKISMKITKNKIIIVFSICFKALHY